MNDVIAGAAIGLAILLAVSLTAVGVFELIVYLHERRKLRGGRHRW